MQIELYRIERGPYDQIKQKSIVLDQMTGFIKKPISNRTTTPAMKQETIS